jgi:hypothetical protein
MVFRSDDPGRRQAQLLLRKDRSLEIKPGKERPSNASQAGRRYRAWYQYMLPKVDVYFFSCQPSPITTLPHLTTQCGRPCSAATPVSVSKAPLPILLCCIYCCCFLLPARPLLAKPCKLLLRLPVMQTRPVLPALSTTVSPLARRLSSLISRPPPPSIVAFITSDPSALCLGLPHSSKELPLFTSRPRHSALPPPHLSR